MSAIPTMPEALAHDWRQLRDLIDETAERQPIPCRSSEIAHPSSWTSEDGEDQAAAAIECMKCPALLPCRRFGLAQPKEVGVFGGMTETERRRAARQKETTNA